MKTLVIISVLSIVTAMTTYFLQGPSKIILIFSIIAAATIIFFMINIYRLAEKIEAGPTREKHFRMRGHVMSHVIPVAYFTTHYFMEATLLSNVFYLIPLMLFYYTGKLTWTELYKEFGSSMYKIFNMGNSSLLIMSPLMLGLGLVNAKMFGQMFQNTQVGYFTTHILLAGIAYLKIKNDVMNKSAE